MVVRTSGPSVPRAVVELLLPAPCLACDRPGRGRARELGLCAGCRRRLEPHPPEGATACAGCGRPLAGRPLPVDYCCDGCRRRPPPFERILAGWSYAPPFDAVILALKFGRLGFLGNDIAAALWRRFADRLAGCEVVVPVPLHWRRRLRRGYNQAARIAAPLARRLDRPLVRALRRHRATPEQARLALAARPGNIRGAFGGRGASLGGRRTLLVDDVTTSGATLRAAAAALRRHGSGPVVALAAARTPEIGNTGTEYARFGP